MMRLVFVHGFACSSADWRAQREALDAQHEVITVDLPGHAATRGSLADASIARFAERVCELLPQRAVLIGHSMGCRVVLDAARRRPERVAGLVLVDGSRVGEGDPRVAVRNVETQVDAVGYPKFIDAFFAAMAPSGGIDPAALAARARSLPVDFGKALFLDIVRWDATHLDGALAALKVPLMAIQSTAMNAARERVSLRDGETSPYLELLRSRLPGARIEVIPGVGHFTQIEAADEVSRLIGEFVAPLR